MKNEFSRNLKIKLIGVSALRIAVIIIAYFVIGVLIYNTGIEEWLQSLLQGIFGDLYHDVVKLIKTIAPLILVGIVIIMAYKPVVTAINYLQKIIDFVDALFQNDDAYIQLPEDLRLVGKQLNLLKTTAVNNGEFAKQAERRKNDLVVYLAHDIKTPLTSIIGYLNLLDEAPDIPLEQRAKYIGITLEKAYRLEELVNEFFEITTFNLQSIVLNKEKINLYFMLQQMADEFYPLLAPHGKQVIIHIAENMHIFGDADKLARVFNNIIKNAIVHSYENSTIRISAIEEKDRICITFSNHCAPIPSDKLESIFERFFRLDTSRSSHTGGAGLGLAIAKEIASAHGGNITAQSNKEETVFTVILPNDITTST